MNKYIEIDTNVETSSFTQELYTETLKYLKNNYKNNFVDDVLSSNDKYKL